MTDTLIYKDTIQRVGYTVIDNVKVVQHTCIIASDNPTDMRVTMTKLDPALYEKNRDICRRDFGAFEDAAYMLRDELIAKKAE